MNQLLLLHSCHKTPLCPACIVPRGGEGMRRAHNAPADRSREGEVSTHQKDWLWSGPDCTTRGSGFEFGVWGLGFEAWAWKLSEKDKKRNIKRAAAHWKKKQGWKRKEKQKERGRQNEARGCSLKETSILFFRWRASADFLTLFDDRNP